MKRSLSNIKSNFRRTSKWKKFRKSYDGETDTLTQSKLKKGWNLHHMCLDETQYENLSDRSNFIPLNKSSHECVHFLYRYYKKDKDILKRLEDILLKMSLLDKK